jgi:hypothetical protein
VITLYLPRELECFCSMDWGRLAPGCLGWWIALPAEPSLRYHIVQEWKFAGLDDDEIADGYHEHTKALGLRSKPRYIAGDPSMWIADGRNAARGQSRAETFQRARMPMRKALNDRVSGWARVARFLRVPVDREGHPTGEPPILTIDEGCPYLRRSLPALMSDKTNPDDVDTNGDDHGGDMVRYGAVSRPMPTTIVTDVRPPKGSAGAMLAELRAGLGKPAVLGSENVARG